MEANLQVFGFQVFGFWASGLLWHYAVLDRYGRIARDRNELVRQAGAEWNDWKDASDGSETNQIAAPQTAIVERRPGGN